MTAPDADDLAARFATLAGRSPAGVWSAPGRANLIGEHTDYNDGFVLPFAIDRSTLAAVAPRDDGRVRAATTWAADVVETDLDDVAPGRVDGWAAYPLGVAWALRGEGLAVPGFDLLLTSDVPVGAGLSSSAAVECAVAVALAEIAGGPAAAADRAMLVRAGHRAENDVVGAPTGVMDQSASLHGRADAAVFLDCRSLAVRTVPLGLDDAGLAVVVIDTRVTHAHADGGYGERRRSCERAAAALGVAALRDVAVDDLDRARDVLDDETFRRARHVVTEDDRVLATVAALERDGAGAIGELLDASHASMRDDFEISCPELDLAVETARGAGAVGARMTGGGFGGSAIALTPAGAVGAVTAAVGRAFADRGWRDPDAFVVRAADGAHRLR